MARPAPPGRVIFATLSDIFTIRDRAPVALRVLQVEDSRITGHDERSRLARRPGGVPGTPGDEHVRPPDVGNHEEYELDTFP